MLLVSTPPFLLDPGFSNKWLKATLKGWPRVATLFETCRIVESYKNSEYHKGRKLQSIASFKIRHLNLRIQFVHQLFILSTPQNCSIYLPLYFFFYSHGISHLAELWGFGPIFTLLPADSCLPKGCLGPSTFPPARGHGAPCPQRCGAAQAAVERAVFATEANGKEVGLKQGTRGTTCGQDAGALDLEQIPWF